MSSRRKRTAKAIERKGDGSVKKRSATTTIVKDATNLVVDDDDLPLEDENDEDSNEIDLVSVPLQRSTTDMVFGALVGVFNAVQGTVRSFWQHMPGDDTFDLPRSESTDQRVKCTAFGNNLILVFDTQSVGFFLIEKVKKVCIAYNVPVKPADRWGVTMDCDNRMTPKLFGDYKSSLRLKTEADAIDYMQNFSVSRQDGLAGFCIAGTVASSGTGKTRLLDDLARVPLASPHFEHCLRLPISFNGIPDSVAFAHPLTVRVLFQFVCGTFESSDATNEPVLRAMREIDAWLDRCSTKFVDIVALSVLNAIEAVYFSMRGGILGRNVMLVDELACVKFPSGTAERAVFDTLQAWLNDGVIGNGGASRRGVIYTGLTVDVAWAEMSPLRPIVWLPLGRFDVWDKNVQAAIQAQASATWPGCGPIQPKVWALLAATGGRPREIYNMLKNVQQHVDDLNALDDHRLVDLLYEKTRSSLFASYLLPSLLNVKFDPFDDNVPTQFGRDVASLALLNADCLADKFPVVPIVSLRYVNSLPNETDDRKNLLEVVRTLVPTLIFQGQSGAGKDFERAWALLMLCVLQLQHLVRCFDAHSFWPLGNTAELGGPSRPKGKVIDVFARSVGDRIDALFSRPRRIFTGLGSVDHKITLTDSPPTLALWRDLWTATVQPGLAVPDGWPAQMQLDVEWRSPCVVCFESERHKAVDFMLLVGEEEPHVYMFQSNARDLNSAIAKLDTQLKLLFAPGMAKTHVLRKAGVHSAQQVTLCLASITFGAIELKDPPFNVVLFDRADFKSMCGGAFRHTT